MVTIWDEWSYGKCPRHLVVWNLEKAKTHEEGSYPQVVTKTSTVIHKSITKYGPELRIPFQVLWLLHNTRPPPSRTLRLKDLDLDLKRRMLNKLNPFNKSEGQRRRYFNLVMIKEGVSQQHSHFNQLCIFREFCHGLYITDKFSTIKTIIVVEVSIN